MARRIKSRKRKYLGNRSYGGGNTKNRRGKGNKGGKGRAGWHKHKWFATIKKGEFKSRKSGFASSRIKPETVSLTQLSRMIEQGKFKKNGEAYEISLPKARVVACPGFNYRASVKAAGFSKKAAEFIKAAGGTAESQQTSRRKEKTSAKE